MTTGKKFLLLSCLTALAFTTSCKISDDKMTFCEAVNRKREECPKLQIKCDAVMATTKSEVAAKVSQCPVAPTSGEFILMPSFTEIGASPCCVMARPSPQRK